MRMNGKAETFSNCDANPNSYIALRKDPNPSGRTNTDKEDTNPNSMAGKLFALNYWYINILSHKIIQTFSLTSLQPLWLTSDFLALEASSKCNLHKKLNFIL